MKRKLLTLLLALVLIISIIPIYDIKADDRLDPVVSFEGMTSEEILNYILDSYRGIYNFDENGTFEDYLDYVVNKLPYFTKNNISYNLDWSNSYPSIIGTMSDPVLNYVHRCNLTWGFYRKGMDGIYRKVENAQTYRYLILNFSLSNDFKRAEDLYDTLADFVEKYYAKSNFRNNKSLTSTQWYCAIPDRAIVGFSQWDSMAYHILEMYKHTINTDECYMFSLILIHPEDLIETNEYALSFLQDSSKVAQPVINSITNKKNKKIVVKYTEENASKKGIYTIQYSTNKNFKNAKEVESKKTSTTISKLKKNKTYYVRVKYTINGQSSDWSEVKTIKIKK